MLSILLFVAGIFIGFFLWSSIWGSLFASIPVRRMLIRMNKIKSMNWAQIFGSIAIASVLLVLALIYLPALFYGTLVSCVMMLFNVSKLRQEELGKHIINEAHESKGNQ